jgi:putative phosphoribosyl transferase
MEPQATQREVVVRVGDARLPGTLVIPPRPLGLVLFAHGSGSSRHSPRNRYVAQVLQKAGFATLLMDLLTPAEERLDAPTGHLRFDIEFLARRLVGATDWLAEQASTRDLPLAYFGASTGAAAALCAAAQRPATVRAVVSRGGRPDLAGDSLGAVEAATLLIVGGADRAVLALNQEAFECLAIADKALQVIVGAGHLFEEAGALEQVAASARDWFAQHLAVSTERAVGE